METTLILIKPDAIQRNFIGKIIKRFEEKGLRIVGLKMLQMTELLAEKHYVEHIGKPFYPALIKFMTSSPIIAIAIEGVGAVEVCRKMTGATFGIKAEPGTIRGDFGISTSFNLIHSSENREAAARELPIFFEANEIFKYSKSLDFWISHEEDKKSASK